MPSEHDGYAYSKARMKEKERAAGLSLLKILLAAVLGGIVGYAVGGVAMAAVLCAFGALAMEILGEQSRD